MEPKAAPNNLQQNVAQATSKLETILYNFLQWYTSWFYWGTGIFLGLTAGLIYGAKTYIFTVIYDLFHFFERPAPEPVKQATRAPPPSTVPASAQAAAAKTTQAARAAATRAQQAVTA